MTDHTSRDGGNAQANPIDAIFSCLANSERRRVLGLLSENGPDPVPTGELATALAARAGGADRTEVTDEQRQHAEITLHHTHLPALAEADLVVHNREDGTVALAAHPAFEDSGVRSAIGHDAPASPGELDDLFGALADARRRAALDVLSHQFGPIHCETLARELEAYGRDVAESEVSGPEVDRTLVRLEQVDLPRLSDAGLVAYDADEGTVAYEGHPQLRVPWMHSMLQPAFTASLTEGAEADGRGEIEGRDRVISYGQALCERAEEELFCMFTGTRLLEAGCLTRIRNASRRGVTVYLGTRDPDVRRYVREHAPGVVLWEPDSDWLTLPAGGDRVGRLLLADREAVMIGTLLEETTDGLHEERAIVGEGEHETLVTVVRQLLGPHLEEIDDDPGDDPIRLSV